MDNAADRRPGRAALAARPAIDRAYLARFTLGNTDLEREVLGLFAGQAPSYLDRLASARSPQDWRDAAHTLKGSAAAVGALHVAELAEVAERLDRAGPGAASDAERARAVAALGRAIETACRIIADLQR